MSFLLEDGDGFPCLELCQRVLAEQVIAGREGDQVHADIGVARPFEFPVDRGCLFLEVQRALGVTHVIFDDA